MRCEGGVAPGFSLVSKEFPEAERRHEGRGSEEGKKGEKGEKGEKGKD